MLFAYPPLRFLLAGCCIKLISSMINNFFLVGTAPVEICIGFGLNVGKKGVSNSETTRDVNRCALR